ncbi:S1 RNA binding domain protein, partial [Vibrio parahaemolyticus VPTS-2010_2]
KSLTLVTRSKLKFLSSIVSVLAYH